jgi:L-cysteine desulfidase
LILLRSLNFPHNIKTSKFNIIFSDIIKIKSVGFHLKASKFFKDVMNYSMGCTEPSAIGLCVATAYSVLNGKIPRWLEQKLVKKSLLVDYNVKLQSIKEIIIRIDKDTFRNALNVKIPNSKGLKGPINAALLGLFSDMDMKLELFNSINESTLPKINEILKEGKCKLVPEFNWHGLRIEAELITDNHYSLVQISNEHSHITLIKVDDKEIFKEILENAKLSHSLKQLKNLNFEEMFNIVENLPQITEILLKESIKLNKNAFEKSKMIFSKRPNNSLGLKLKELIDEKKLSKDFLNITKYKVVTAIEGRMEGLPLKIMTCAGSGNIGLTVSLAFEVLESIFKKGETKVLSSLALTHLITNYIALYSGYLSALCGCSIKAGIGLAVGITHFFLDEKVSKQKRMIKYGAAINNVIESIAGVICDGAKKGCALKVISSIDAAYTSALLALKTDNLNYSEGIISENPIESIRNIEVISKAMTGVDDEIIKKILFKNKNIS